MIATLIRKKITKFGLVAGIQLSVVMTMISAMRILHHESGWLEWLGLVLGTFSGIFLIRLGYLYGARLERSGHRSEDVTPSHRHLTSENRINQFIDYSIGRYWLWNSIPVIYRVPPIPHEDLELLDTQWATLCQYHCTSLYRKMRQQGLSPEAAYHLALKQKNIDVEQNKPI
ncbi:MAG: hypothetical protein Q6L60_14090 [Thermostichus sp. HHBFW_bins_43]